MSVQQDLGTTRWFGDSWGAPICDPRTHVPTPAGEFCMDCRVRIELGDRGVTLPHAGSEGWANQPHHLSCFCDVIGIPAAVRGFVPTGQRPLTRALALDLREQCWGVEQIAEEYGREPEEVRALLRA